MYVPNITKIKNNSKSASSKFGSAFKKAATSEAAKASVAVLGGATVLGVGYALFATVANKTYAAIN